MKLTLMHYTPTELQEQLLGSVEGVNPRNDQPGVPGLHMQGLDDPGSIERLGELFQLHPLALEDVVKTPQRPKAEEYEGQDFIVTHTAIEVEETHRLQFVQFSMFVGGNYILSFQDGDKDNTEEVRTRIRAARGPIRQHGVDHLMYALLDSVVDGYFPVLEDFGEYLEAVQENALLGDAPETLRNIQRAKHELLLLRRVVWPQRDLLNVLMRDDNNNVSAPVRHYLRDCYDHVVQLMDMIETYREIASDLMDAYMTAIPAILAAGTTDSQAIRDALPGVSITGVTGAITFDENGDAKKDMAYIKTVFMPLTFMVGVYGMNFNTNVSKWNMPELNWRYGYAFTWAVMIVTSILMVVYFYRKGWIGREDVPTEKDLKCDDDTMPSAKECRRR